MAVFITLLEQHMDRQPTTVVVQGTGWLETIFRHVKLQETGLGVHLPVKVHCSSPHIATCGREASLINLLVLISRTHAYSNMVATFVLVHWLDMQTSSRGMAVQAYNHIVVVQFHELFKSRINVDVYCCFPVPCYPLSPKAKQYMLEMLLTFL